MARSRRSNNRDIQEQARLRAEEMHEPCLCPLAMIIEILMHLGEDPENEARQLAFVTAVRMVWWTPEWRRADRATPLMKAITSLCEILGSRLRASGIEVV